MAFSFQATRDLWRYLGEFDALSEMNEIAVRDLLFRFERVRTVAGDVHADTYITRLSTKHGIKVHPSVIRRLSVGMAQNYVCSVWNCADGFLKELRIQQQKLISQEWTGDAREKSRLTLALENLFGSEQKGTTAIGDHRHQLLEYYRTVRNRVVHPRTTTDKTVAAMYEKLRPYILLLKSEYRVNVSPSPFAEMCFEDSLLLSRVLKDVAELLNKKAQPSAEVLLNAIGEDRFRRLRNNPTRWKNAMAGDLTTRFGLDPAEARGMLERAH